MSYRAPGRASPGTLHMTRRLFSPRSRLAPPPSRWKEPPKRADAHYNTPEHKAWAKEAKDRAGWRCEECGTESRQLYADHIIEVKDAREAERIELLLDPSNARVLCASCHGRKSAIERRKRAFGDGLDIG